jgi:type IV pilus assembly protein PilY1
VLSDNTPDWQVTTTPDGSACGNYPESGTQCDPECSGCNADPLVHAGWYVDLSESSARVIADPLISLGILNYVTFTPEDSPCGGEGDSFTNYADPCNGGNLGEAFIDINLDGVINEEDLINIGTEAEPIWVAPSGRQYQGRLQAPAIVEIKSDYDESTDRYIYSSSVIGSGFGGGGGGGGMPGDRTKSRKTGIIYWKDLLN